MSPSRPAVGGVRRPAGSRAHTLLWAHTDALRRGAAAWVDHELASGSKVYYKGWLPDDRLDRDHWLLADPARSTTADALRRGQLEVMGFPAVIERCGGTTEGLHRLQEQELRAALGSGWSTVAMTQETTYRELGTDAEIAEFTAQEHGYDRLARLWPLNTLCQLWVDVEREVAITESLAVHHRDLVGQAWSTSTVAGRWHVVGELDLAERGRFRAALRGHLDVSRRDVHLDLGRVTFMDASCAQVLVEASDHRGVGARFVLHRTPPLVAELLALVGAGPGVTVLSGSDPGTGP